MLKKAHGNRQYKKYRINVIVIGFNVFAFKTQAMTIEVEKKFIVIVSKEISFMCMRKNND